MQSASLNWLRNPRTSSAFVPLTKVEERDYAQTVSCYQADLDGRACGRCDSCRLRSAGFAAAGITDPTRYVA